MSTYIRSSGTHPLETLLQWVATGQIVLPEFQRDLVWTPQMMSDLLVSLSNSHPAGSLIALQNTNQFAFRPVYGDDPAALPDRPNYLLLDGQQRITSLYHAFFGRGEYRFFVDMKKLAQVEDLDEDGVILFVRWTAKRGRDRQRRQALEDFKGQAESRMLPLSAVMGDRRDVEAWIRDVSRLEPNRDEADRLQDELTEVRKRFIDPLTKYHFPWIELGDETPAAAVCTIFEDLNRRGVRLGVFDLLVARFYPPPAELRLRDMWNDAQEEYDNIRTFDVDAYYVLQIVSLLDQFERAQQEMSGTIPRAKPKFVMDLSADSVLKWWMPAAAALDEALKRLGEDCGVVVPKWLPYETMLIPLSCVLAYRRSADGAYPVGAARTKLARWFWCSVFAQTYDQGASTQMGTDFVELDRWLRGGDPPMTVQEFDSSRIDLDQIGPRQQALYKGVIALVLSNRPLDFRNAAQIERSQVEGEVDDHHIFPRGYLGNAVSDERQNVVLNKTLIDRDTNNWIRKKAPSDYLTAIRDGTPQREGLGAERLQAILGSHLIPTEDLWTDQFERFLERRKEVLMARISDVTSR